MAKNLVIVESPAKAKTIEGYLGKDFVVKSSFGHVRDLPTKGDKVIDIDNDFTPTSILKMGVFLFLTIMQLLILKWCLLNLHHLIQYRLNLHL